MPSIRVYLLDDQAILRAGFRSLINQYDDLMVVGESGEARHAVGQIEELQPDVVLLDITMPGLSGIDAIPLIRKAAPKVRIVMLTHHEGQSFVDQALRLGADGYVSKDSEPEELALALRSGASAAQLAPQRGGGLHRLPPAARRTRGGHDRRPARALPAGGHPRPAAASQAPPARREDSAASP